MRPWGPGLICAALALLAGCGGKEVLEFTDHEAWAHWKVTAWQEEPGKSRAITWRREGATSPDSPEWVTYQSLPKPSGDSAEAILNKQKALAEQRCPGGVWHVIRQDASDILFDGKLTNCPRDPDEIEIARIVYGHDEMFRLTYTARAAELSPAQREEAMRLLLGARLAPVSKSRTDAPSQAPRAPGSRGGRRRSGGGGA